MDRSIRKSSLEIIMQHELAAHPAVIQRYLQDRWSVGVVRAKGRTARKLLELRILAEAIERHTWRRTTSVRALEASLCASARAKANVVEDAIVGVCASRVDALA